MDEIASNKNQDKASGEATEGKVPPAGSKCCTELMSGYHLHRCGRAAKVEVNGKCYCGVHDPIKNAAKDKVRSDAWDAKWNAMNARDRRRSAEREYCKHLTTEELEAKIAAGDFASGSSPATTSDVNLEANKGEL